MNWLSGTLTVEAFCATQHRGIANDLPESLRPNAIRVGSLWDAANRIVPMIITSGYRSPALNQAVHGHPQSAHREARAFDAVPQSIDVYSAMKALVGAMERHELPVDKILIESALGRRWLHLQVAREGMLPRRSAAMSFNGKDFLPWDPMDPMALKLTA